MNESKSNWNKATVSVQKLIENLVDQVILELGKDSSKDMPKIRRAIKALEDSSKDYIQYVTLLTTFLKREVLDNPRANKINVLIAIISKINDLRVNGLLTDKEPNWLKESPYSIDIFNIDYNSNDSIRRFINSIIQFLLRKQGKGEFRVLVIDEAHMLLNEGSRTSNLLKQLLREARKFNITVIYISQNLKDIPEEILTQFQNQFRFRQMDIETTAFYPDQVCNVSLYGSKLNFAMKVNNIKFIVE